MTNRGMYFNEFGAQVAGLAGGTCNGGASVAGLFGGTCNGGATVAGLAGGLPNCYGPAFFWQKLNAFQGIPVNICTEDEQCWFGQIIEVCADYLTFNSNGALVIIPLRQITRISLASTSGGLR